MEYDDVIYLLLLFFTIGFGSLYRKIEDVEQKKWIGTGVGLIVVFLVSGFHILHIFITIFANAAIILCLGKRRCHLASFVFSFLYLFFFRTVTYFGIPDAPGHTNLVQMMLTLKLVGLAFEVNSSYLEHREKPTNSIDKDAEIACNNVNPSLNDIIHYSFNYVGVLTGPYFRYRTFQDYFKYRFCNYADCKAFTIEKLTYIPVWAVLFLGATYLWPLSYTGTDEFTQSSWLYRFWYVWPNFFIFRMRIYIGLTLSECACSMAGLGVYPAITEPKPGQGPSTSFDQLDGINNSEVQLKSETYSVETIHNVSPMGAEFCTTYREGMKHWNICIQYWLAVNVYKRFPSKQYRTLAVVLVSAVWHGVYTGYYVCILSVPFVLLIEDVLYKLFLKDAPKRSGYFDKSPTEWAMWVFKMFAFSYFAIAFHLLELGKIWKYYNSIYHAGIVIGLALYGAGIQMLKARRRIEKKEEKRRID